MPRFHSLQQWQKNQIAVSASASGVWLGNTLVMPFLPIFVRELGVEGTGAIAFWTGLLFAISPGLSALTGPLWGRIGDRYGLKLVTARAVAGNSICWFFMLFAENVWHVLIIRALLGVLGGFNNVSVAAITQLFHRMVHDRGVQPGRLAGLPSRLPLHERIFESNARAKLKVSQIAQLGTIMASDVV